MPVSATVVIAIVESFTNGPILSTARRNMSGMAVPVTTLSDTATTLELPEGEQPIHIYSLPHKPNLNDATSRNAQRLEAQLAPSILEDSLAPRSPFTTCAQSALCDPRHPNSDFPIRVPLFGSATKPGRLGRQEETIRWRRSAYRPDGGNGRTCSQCMSILVSSQWAANMLTACRKPVATLEPAADPFLCWVLRSVLVLILPTHTSNTWEWGRLLL
ncbi:hypothetical protein BDV96DRAFT_595435 [Lophiotrema nucula]|uniref:Uncharacterized protein n=1 Tax=Lophiotrema nucula TaxID=690887 RepID=A0A6A5ZJP1_9PLEO|nr:hypothetical protein BDV96DRAFT_595435 [Lophiotrema nucula]